MPPLRRLIRTFFVLLVAIFGTVAAFAAQRDWSQADYPVAEQQLITQTPNLAFTARAPPPTSENLAITGAPLARIAIQVVCGSPCRHHTLAN